MKMKIKKGDLVKVITGKAAKSGLVGKVLEVYPKENRIKVEGLAEYKKHLKPQKDPKNPEGGIVTGLATVHASNVMLMSETLGRPVRTGSVVSQDGAKQRCVRGRGLKAEVI